MNKEKKPTVQIDAFTKYYDGVMEATSVTNTITGVCVELTLNDKSVYHKMLAAYKFHSGSGREFFESQDSLADKLGIERKTVGRAIKKLEDVDLISHRTEGCMGAKRNIYKVVDVVGNKLYLFEKKTTNRTLVDKKIVVEVVYETYTIARADKAQQSYTPQSVADAVDLDSINSLLLDVCYEQNATRN